MNADRDYFGGCHNVPMSDTPVAADVGYGDEPISALFTPAEQASLADYVRTIDARRIVAQLELPDGQIVRLVTSTHTDADVSVWPSSHRDC